MWAREGRDRYHFQLSEGTLDPPDVYSSAMGLAESLRPPIQPEFQNEALRWLPHVARYARLLTRNPADADDLAQETFLRAYQNWGTFRPGSDCRKWLFTICRNAFLRDRQRAARFVAADDPDVEVRAATDLYERAMARGVQHLFDRIDLGPAIERSLRDLLPEYREVVILVDIEDCSYADAAHVMGIPVGTVRSRLFRARRLLQQSLIEYAKDLGFGEAAALPPDQEQARL